MSALKDAFKRGLVRAVAGVAPVSWRWRTPGSLVVLMYHRVLPANSPVRRVEQPGMYVSPGTLDLHLTELVRRFELVHLNDWLRRVRQGEALPRLACAITFDDGWQDNFEFAFPVLMKHAAPATIFLVSSYVGSMRRFWPNRLMSLLAKSFGDSRSVHYPDPLRLIVEPVLASARRRGQLQAADTDGAVRAAKRFDEQRIRQLISVAEESCEPCGKAREILGAEEIAQMAATGLVRFGSHTMTHFRLGGDVSHGVLEQEIVRSRDQIQGICGQRVELFCYPNGETSPEGIALIRRHYLGAVTTQPGWHVPSGDAYLMRRIGLHEDISNSTESFLARLSGWV